MIVLFNCAQEREIQMKLATRLNSFLPKRNNNLEKVFSDLKTIGISYVDLNYPEHTRGIAAEVMKTLLDHYDLKANGVALRFREQFINGELGNSNRSISLEALQLCKEAADYCRLIGGEVVTIWLGFDGFDYPFQIDYQQVWDQVKNSIIEIADYAPDIKFSIEYKPFEERSYAFLDSVGTTALMVNDIGRKNVGITLDYCHMLMKHENPAYSVSIAAARGKLFGIHLNDGYGTFDDGLMVGSASLMQTLEFLYYVKLSGFDSAIYFDTFPVREEACAECRQNMEITEKLFSLIDRIGMDRIDGIIKSNSAIEANRLLFEILK